MNIDKEMAEKIARSRVICPLSSSNICNARELCPLLNGGTPQECIKAFRDVQQNCAIEALKTDEENLTPYARKRNEELKERTDEVDSNAVAREIEQKQLKEEFIAARILQNLLALSYGQGGVCYDIDIKAVCRKYGIELGGIGEEE